MPTEQHLQAVQRGREALARGAWEDAEVTFTRALTHEESAEALEGLGLAAWWLDRFDGVFDARERAYALYRERGDHAAAARMAVWLAWDCFAFRGEQAVANGWFRRAHTLLKDLPPCPEHAWLAVREAAYSIFDHGDPDAALRLAEQAIQAARQVGAVDLEMIGRALAGLARVTAGSVADGMRELDEVNAAVVAGELHDLVAIGLSGCYLIAACERVRDYDRAVQWCNRLKAFCAKWGLRPLFAVCRTQYASVCIWRGTWTEADEELSLATSELSACRPAMTPEGLVRHAELRRRQGRLDEAAAMFEQAEPHPLASLGRAELALDRGHAKNAADLAERYLRHLPSPNRIERAWGLELLIRAEVAQGHLSQAEAALRELRDIASQAGTLPLSASASLAAGFVAGGASEHETARRHFEDAVDRYQQGSAPFETARARIELARTLAILARHDDARREAERAMETLSSMNAVLELARARALAEGAEPADDESSRVGTTTSGLTRRELEVLRLVSEGLPNQQIGERLFVSAHTVHRHMANILTKLNVTSRAAAVAQATRQKLI